MDGSRPDVSGLSISEETALLTVWARALDARRAEPILGDRLAVAVTDALAGGYDFAGLGVLESTERFVALRARMLDDRVRAFVAAHPDAVLVDLGAGLSGAVHRIDPPPTVECYSVDTTAMCALRAALLPARPRTHDVAASLADPAWCAGLPTDRPTVLIADGLFAFLDEATLAALFRRITEHFAAGGELMFYDYGRASRAGRALARAVPTRARMGGLLTAAWRFDGFADARYPLGWNPRLRLVEETSAFAEPELTRLGTRWRLMVRAARRLPSLRRSARVLRYAFAGEAGAGERPVDPGGRSEAPWHTPRS